MSSLRIEPAPEPARFPCLPLGHGDAGDWTGRWADGPGASVVLNIALLNAEKREYDVVVRERLTPKSSHRLCLTFVQIYESRLAAPPALEQVRTLLLPEHGILLGLFRMLGQVAHGRLVRYQRPSHNGVPAVDIMLRPTPRVS